MISDDEKNNEEEDLEDEDLEPDFGEDSDFIDDFDDEEKKNTLGYLWKNNPLVKVGIVLGVAALLIGFVIFIGSGSEKPEQSVITSGSEITQVPGTAEVSPSIKKALEEVNVREVERAKKEGDSALPIQIDPPSEALPVPEEKEEEEDPLQRWRRLQEERLQKELERTEVVEPAPPEPAGPSPATEALAQAMSTQMQSILEQLGGVNVNHKVIADSSFLDELYNTNEEEEAAAGETIEGESVILENVLFPAGEIVYGQLLTEANSDIPGPTLAYIASGPLKGSRLIGEFSVSNELIALTFNMLVYEGRSIPVNAVALDPGTTLPGMATEVDRRYFSRVILPAAAAFVEGAAEAISESGRTNITIQGETVAEETEDTDTRQEVASGIEEAGAELGELLQERSEEIETLVRIESGTGLGILFLEPVVEQTEVESN